MGICIVRMLAQFLCIIWDNPALFNEELFFFTLRLEYLTV